jgi:superfamily I DNA and/or RNA helicase
MGDQMQLGQPIQGGHSGDSGLSILEYLLKDQATIPVDMGVFLSKTYRMHSDVCRLSSEQVYDGRLESAEVTNQHVIEVPSNILPINHGVQFFSINHQVNTQRSEEEVGFIKDLAEQLIGLPYWPETLGEESRSIWWFDILFGAPYNY